jgi:hypothetical protein
MKKNGKKNGVYIEVDGGCEGDSLSIMEIDEQGNGGGKRLVGPKAWGGSETLYSFQIFQSEADEIREVLDRNFPKEAAK